ncbi:LuxR C-terminal-related transcriptional regulator [Chloroflexus sp.]|uniref:Kelch repeat-containing protein n=1 Tax=Chloroflexus sp. TaxID=1904827 RepID=UPI002ADD5815|nr:LuxR C-terminal-related transcriptional regulator [Chloroflexus sp.]
MTNESQISEREREILRLVATGATNQQIAIALNISVNTVKVHLRNIFAKIGVESRTEATVYAIRNGIVTVGETGQNAIDESKATAQSDELTAVTSPPVSDVAASNVESTEPLVLHTEPPTGSESADTVSATLVEEPVASTAPLPVPSAAKPVWLQLLLWLIGGIVVIAIAVATLVINARSGTTPVTAAPTSSPIINAQQRWFLRQPLSEPRDHFALTGYDLERRLYVIGGQRNGVVSAAVDRYDPEINRWVRLTDKPTAVSHARAVTLRGLIYVPGGEDSNGTVLDRLEIYDPREQRWYSGPSLPAPRSRYALTAWEGQLYLIGGWDGTSVRSDVFVYDPVRERWESAPALPQPRRDAGVAVAGGRLFVIGGEGEQGPLRDSHRLEPGNDPNRRWAAIAPLPQAIARPAVVGLASTLLIFDSERREGLTYDIVADAWSSTPLPAEANIATDAVLLDSNIYFVGDSRTQGMLSEYRALYVIFIPGQ